MKEYIEREAAVKAAKDGADEWDGGHNRNRDSYIECAIDNIPTADVRPVVLCRDCRWWAKEEKSLQGRNTGMNICRLGGFYSTGEWFCANGERPYCGEQMKEDTE